MSERTPSHEAGHGTLGTFAGVFTPSILTILGIILFLRLGYVVGSVGLGRALVIIALANLISVLTSFSLSAIATNIKVKAGGDYYLISRTLGVEFGGAIGIVLFLAQSVSIAFYTIGFGEVVAALFPGAPGHTAQVIAALAVAVLFVLAWLGSDWATRFQYGVMAVLFAAIATFFVGGVAEWDAARLVDNWAPSGAIPFWAAFALFFPAVTGFTQGMSMSGDLRDAGTSLPLGTFLAVGLSAAVYLAVAVVFAAALPGGDLVADYGAMRRVAPAAWLIDAGVIAATLSSALASFLGAPRILQSLAHDRIFPLLTPFAAGVGPANNPRRGVLLSGAIGLSAIALGDLNLIAPVVSMFFLISYGLLNYATYSEASAKSPSFRPRFRWFDPRLSLTGCIACGGAVIATNPTAGAVALALLMAIHQYLRRSTAPERWADSSRSARFQRVREHLHAMAGELPHPRDWRPSILAFSEQPERRARLIRFATWIEGGSGITTAVQVVEGEGLLARRRKEKVESELAADLRQREVQAFALSVVAPDLATGLPLVLQSYGVGPLRANTVLLSWFDREAPEPGDEGLHAFGRYLRTALRYGCNVVVLEATTDEMAHLDTIEPDARRIDVWWQGDATSRLALLFAYLMGRQPEWKGSQIRVLTTAAPDQTAADALDALHQVLADVRIDARGEVVAALDSAQVVERSRDASLVFLPFRLKGEEPRAVFEGSLDGIFEPLPITALVLAAEDIVLDSEPDEGQQGEIAAALDAATDAERRAKVVAKEAQEAADTVVAQRSALEEAHGAGVAGEALAALKEAVDAAEKAAAEASRRAVKARAKADLAEREAAGLTDQPTKETGE
ncbi:MAG: amino acid permease [Nitrospirota bacterium]|jgi:amino acid transporter